MKKGIRKKSLCLGLAFVMAIAAVPISRLIADAAETDDTVERVGYPEEIPGTTSTFSDYNASFLSVTGYAEGSVNARDTYIDTTYYRKVSTPHEFLKAIEGAQKGEVKVIEIMKDIDLGYGYTSNYVYDAELYPDGNGFVDQGKLNSGYTYTNPTLEGAGGPSNIRIDNVDGLTIFSQYGATLKHAMFNFQSDSKDIVIRNLGFDGLWQWDNTGSQKECEWTYIKVNGSKNVWIDHCSFTIASDGNIDLENGACGVTVSWCKFGLPTSETPGTDSMIYASINYMEKLYQAGTYTVNKGTLYADLRKAGLEKEQIMAYTAWHSKVHLTGSGDKDYKDGTKRNSETGELEPIEDGNQRLQLSLGYNWYTNIAQRVPMIRQGQGHMFNCYVDDMEHRQLLKDYPLFQSVAKAGGYSAYTMSRCLNARNGASIAADTCVFYGIDNPIIGSEYQGQDISNANEPWSSLIAEMRNHVLIVNSRVTNGPGSAAYNGGSWDGNDKGEKGVNAFTKGFEWYDKSTIDDWAWSYDITGIKNTEITMEELPKDLSMQTASPDGGEKVYVYKDAYWIPKAAGSNSFDTLYEPFTVVEDTEAELPYDYQLVELNDVEEIVTTHSGMGVYDLSAKDWLRTTYTAAEEIEPAGDDKVIIANAVTVSPSARQTVSVGGKITFTATVKPNNVTTPEITWKSSDESVLTVDANGEATAKSVGTARVTGTCTSKNGTTVSAQTNVITVIAATGNPTEDPTATPTTEDPTATPATEDPTATPTTEDPTATPTTEDPTATPTTEDPTDSPSTERPTTEPTGTPEPPNREKGDVSGDGEIKLNDAQLALRAALNIIELTGDDFWAADVNGDESIKLNDAQIILRAALNITEISTVKKVSIMMLTRHRLF